VPYATLAQFRVQLKQAAADKETDQWLNELLVRAASLIDGALGWSFLSAGQTWADVALGTKTVRAEQGRWLRLPPYQQGSITALLLAGAAVPGWEEAWEAGRHYLRRDDGWEDARYAVTARFGYGPPPASLVELNLELAVNLFRSRDKGGFTELVGVEGSGGIRFVGGMTKQQQLIIRDVRRQYLDGVH
jgi:hypothetical protein